MKWFRISDELVCHYVEEGYLWLYDWTGIYVGQLVFVCGAIVTWTFADRWWEDPLLVLIGLQFTIASWHTWHRQHTWSQARYNAFALIYQGNPVRVFVKIVNLGCLIGFPAAWEAWVSLILYDCLLTVKLRERKKKEFFARKVFLQGI